MTNGNHYYLRYQDSEESKFLELLFSKLNFVPKGHALDAGCGYGFFTNILAKLGFEEIIGFDLDKERIAKASKAFGNRDSRCKFDVADAVNPPYGKETFDLVFCRGLSTLYTQDISQGCKQCDTFYDLLRPNGFLILICASDLSGKMTTGKIINQEMSTIAKFVDKTKQSSQHWNYFVFAKHYSTKLLGKTMFSGFTSSLAVLLTKITKRQGYIVYVIRKGIVTDGS